MALGPHFQPGHHATRKRHIYQSLRAVDDSRSFDHQFARVHLSVFATQPRQ